MKINMKNNSKCIKTDSRVMEDLNNPINIEHGSRVNRNKYSQKTNHRKHQVKEDSQQNSTKS